MNWILIPVMAILNRLRGSDGEGWLWEHRWPVSFLGTLGSGVVLAFVFGGWSWPAALVVLAYFLGEAAPGPNWGVACGAISNHSPGYRQQYPLLAIRGVIWWLPVLAVFWWFGRVALGPAVAAVLALGVMFPLCMDAGRVPAARWRWPYLRSPWEWGEYIYGGVVGLIFTLI